MFFREWCFGGARLQEMLNSCGKLFKPELLGGGVPGELLGEDFAGRVGVDDGMDAQAGADVAGIRKSPQDDMETVGSFLDGGFGEAGDQEEAASDWRIASSVEGGRRFGVVGRNSGVEVERGAGADIDFNLVEGAERFDDAKPP